MAFPQPNAQRDLATRKILEELQLKKQLLLKQGVQATTTVNSVTTNLSPLPTATGAPNSTGAALGTDSHSMSSAQRAALHAAHTQSFGYFVTQDSSFGNLILPVLPRYDTK